MLGKKLQAARPGDVGAGLVVACALVAVEAVLRAGIDVDLDLRPLGLDGVDIGQRNARIHFGEKDAGIPLTDVDTIKAKRPEVEIHVYPGAQHGFHCDERASYDKTSADIAWPRSLEFFAKHLKK